MKLTEALKIEKNRIPDGIFAPHYFRYAGYKDNIAADPATLRANGVYRLFADPIPHIFVNDLIVGNTLCLYTTADENAVNHALNMVRCIGLRDFQLNVDHYCPDYRHILKRGIKGLTEDIDASIRRYSGDSDKVNMLNSMRHTLEGFLKMVENYRDAALKALKDPEYDPHRLRFIIKNLDEIIKGAPESFGGALQLVWLIHTAFMMEGRYAMALGRIDQYLYPFYKKEIDAGTLTNDGATELLENVFMKIPHGDVVNIAVGGMDKSGRDETNGLSYCVLHAVGNCNVPGPNLSARITPGTPDEFLDECLKTIGTGLGYPALMNDTVNIAALKKYGYDVDDVYDYSMVGCIENFITGKQPPWSDGRFDAPRFFDYVLNGGISRFNHSAGLDLGSAEDIRTMADFMDNFEKQLSFGVAEYCAAFNARNDGVNQSRMPEPFLSCFCHDCIERGKDVNNGGARYPSVHGAALMGVGTVADSLAAIEKVVFIDRAATLAEVRDAIAANFEGYEELRDKLINAPKYGNNDDFVDKYAVWFLDFLSSEFGKYKTRDGGGMYVAMAANVSNIYAGGVIAATPDGRKQGEPLSDAASPTYGKDKKGVTFTLSSVSKPEYCKAACGTVVNQKFSPSVFSDSRRKELLALIKTYFKMGGQEIQINATSPEVLRDAMEHPENYTDLVVRVSGFSAFYVGLQRSVQMDILNRTQHE